jgi:4-amino-4-deoxy-L-arabinose transferase-like glycosyltransferase
MMTAFLNSRYTRLTALTLLALTAFRLWYSTHLELVGDEAYYWLWSRHPDLCYLDKGPAIAWTIWAGTALFGQTVFGIRFFAVLLASATGFGMFLLARWLFSDRVGFWALVLAALCPLFAVGATLMTIDTIYVAFWTFAALAFWRAKDTTNLGPWALTGALVGIGILAKYTEAVQLLCFALFCAWHAPSRQHFRQPTFALMVAVAGLFLIPLIIWNWQHGWPTSRFLVHRGALDEQARFRPLGALAYLGQQAGVISPLLFFGLLAGVCWPKLARTPRVETGYLVALFVPLFLIYLVLSFQQAGQANWTAAAYIGGLILVAAKWDQLIRVNRRAWGLATLALGLAFVETAILHETSWLHLPPRIDILDRARGSRDLAAKVAALQAKTGAQFVVANKYMTASLLSFYLPGQPTTYMPVSSPPFNQIVLWPTYRQQHPSEEGLFVSDFNLVPSSLREDFADIEPAGEIHTMQDGREVNQFYVFLCRRASGPGLSGLVSP